MAAPVRHPQLLALLQPDEQLLWSGRPDPLLTLRTQQVLWWIAGVWTAGVLAAWWLGWTASWPMLSLLMLPAALFPAPILMVVLGMGTVYGITDRRAILAYDALGYARTFSVKFAEMDETLEIIPIGGSGAGHLYFDSGYKVKSPYIDYKGKLAFRNLKDAASVAALLERARGQWKNRSA